MHQPEAPGEPRTAPGRPRRLASVAGVLLIAIAVAAVVFIESATGSPRHRSLQASRHPVRPAKIKRPTASAPPAWGLESAAEVAAVHRLAAYGLPLFCGGTSKPMVALTFDDGPGVYTHLALKKFRQYRIHATFFLVGKEIRAWPGWAQRERPYADFGDHTMTHPFLPGLPQSAMVQQIAGAQSLIERTVGEPVVLFRPPYEARSAAIQHEVTSRGMLEVLWNVDSQDSLGASYVGIERDVIAGLHPGSIILMHENHGQTIRALPVIFAALARRHLQAVTVPQLIAEDPPTLAQLRARRLGCGIAHHVGNDG